MRKVWFITGSSKGFGRQFTKAALDRGDEVAATARDVRTLDDLVVDYRDLDLPIALDVTDHAAVTAAISRALEHFGRADVIVNNAGYGLFGAAEEITESQLRDQMEVNFLGSVAVTKSVLPVLRQQGFGHLIQISTVGGIGAFPYLSAYHASKWAIEAFTEAMAGEVAEFGIKVTLIEPAGYDTAWMSASGAVADPNPAYDGLRVRQAEFSGAMKLADPTGVGPALLALVDLPEPPLRVLFGQAAYGIVEQIYAERLKTWVENRDITLTAQGN
jgi:NAD(P)-dependent dehydrogenase (short-subunit alcohol dehydrogenase family)